MDERLKVLLVDYDAVTRAGLTSLLAGGTLAEVVGIAEQVGDVQNLLVTLTPDVVITNVQHGNGSDAVEVTKLVKQVSPGIPVVVLAEDERDPHAINAVEAGISAYVLRKEVTTVALEGVLRTVQTTSSVVLSGPLMQTVVSSLTRDANVALKYIADTKVTDLTGRELDVLRLMASGATNREIGRTLGVSHETIRKHVTRIVQKLGARNRTHAVIVGFQAALTGRHDGSRPEE